MHLTKEIQEMVAGVVLLNIPDELAWSMFLDSKDVDEIGLFLHFFPCDASIET